MKKIIMYSHGGSSNHGCEAIVRGTKAIVRGNDYENSMILYSADPGQDIRYGLGEICSVKPQTLPVKRFSGEYLKAVYSRYLKNSRDAYDIVSYRDLFRNSDENTVAFSIGGDNYCYGKPQHIYFMNKYIRKNGARSVLWGCSVEPSAIDEDMAEDLKGYDLITARESISFEALRKINPNTKLYPDPAFVLDKKELPLSEGFSEGNTIGINVSPMIMGYEKQGGTAMKNFTALMEYILNCTDMNIALIPHVVWSTNNDLEPLSALYEEFKDSGRVVLMGDHNCMELKGFISRCRMFIGARTHATIAAYSTCVPTLVVGYSVKAKGIARDIFGSEENMVIPVQTMKNRDDLITAFEYLRQNEERIRIHLKNFMPEYRAGAFESVKEINKLLI